MFPQRCTVIPAVFVMALLLSGCAAGINPVSVVRGVVEHAVEERTTDDAKKDLAIKAKIAAEITDQMGTDVISIAIDVYEQRVMLTGIVETDSQKKTAGNIAQAAENVATVYNDLSVVPALEREKGTVEGFVDDTVIETKIDALLIDASGVNSRNYRWRSVHGRVFLLGRALSASEREKVLDTIRGIEGVLSLTRHIEIRPASE